MARAVKVVLELERSAPKEASAQVWFDSSGNASFEAGEEKALATADGDTWVAELRMPEHGEALFLLRFTAPIGTRWRFQVLRADGSQAFDTGEERLVTKRFLTQLAGEVS
jgi:hypothetical protein